MAGWLGIWECGSDGSNKMNKSCSQQNYIRSNSTTYMYNTLVSSSQSHSALKSFLQENRRIMKKENILAWVFCIDWFGLVRFGTPNTNTDSDSVARWWIELKCCSVAVVAIAVDVVVAAVDSKWTNQQLPFPELWPFQRTNLYIQWTYVHIRKKIQIQKWFLSRFNKSSCWLVATSWRQPFISDSCTGI